MNFYLGLDRLIIFGVSFFACLCILNTLRKVAISVKKTPAWIVPVFALLDAGLVLTVWHSASQPCLTVITVGLPLLLLAELAILAKDTVRARLNYYVIIQLTMLCTWEIVDAAVVLCRRKEDSLIALTAMLLLTGLLCYAVTHFKSCPLAEISDMLHSKNGSLLLLVYMGNAIIALFFSQLILTPAMIFDGAGASGRVLFCVSYLLKDMAILFSGYLMFLFLLRIQRGLRDRQSMAQMLEHEKLVRAQFYQNKLLGYCANITRDRFEEGEAYFHVAHQANSLSYLETLRRFVSQCVYEEDRQKFAGIGLAYYRKRLAESPSYGLRFRVSPAKMLATTNLPQEVRDILESTDAEWMWIDLHVALFQKPQTEDLLAYVSMVDVHNAVTEEIGLRLAAERDPMTKLFNRAALEKRVQQLLEQGGSGALFMIDLDHFKAVNDRWGHQAGDALLCEIADVLRSVFREGDIVGRMGGDEFCAFAPGLKDADVIGQRLDELKRRCRAVMQMENAEGTPVSMSVGIAVAPENGATYQELYRSADIALYQAKRSGRNTHSFYEAGETV